MSVISGGTAPNGLRMSGSWSASAGSAGIVMTLLALTRPSSARSHSHTEADQLPPILQPFGAVPPLVTDISLSIDDRDLYVSCWGTGELKRFDVSDPRAPRETGSVRLGGIVGRAAHPAAGALNGGPQMVETSRDGRRIFLTNSLYAAWDAQFYPEGIDGWLVKLDAGEDGSLTVDPDVFVTYSGERPHQVRLAGGDASSDSYCFPD